MKQKATGSNQKVRGIHNRIKSLQDKLQNLEEDVEEPRQELERKIKEETSRKGRIEDLKKEIEVHTLLCCLCTRCNEDYCTVKGRHPHILSMVQGSHCHKHTIFASLCVWGGGGG